MTKEEDDLKKRVIGILRSDACKAINFEALNVRVRGQGFGRVADLLGGASSNSVFVEINPGFLAGKAAAAFIPRVKTLVFVSGSVGADGPSAAIERQQIVHEATHALVNETMAFNLDTLTSEVVAYISGLVFYTLVGGKAAALKNNIHIEAQKLAIKVTSTSKSIYIFQPTELGPLMRAIKGDYNDGGEIVEGNRKLDVLSPVGVWDVKCGSTSPETSKWQWVYTFKEDGTVSWHNLGDRSTNGSGTWVLSRSEDRNGRIRTKWKGSMTVEDWIPPAIGDPIEGGSDGSTMSGEAYMASGKHKLWGFKS